MIIVSTVMAKSLVSCFFDSRCINDCCHTDELLLEKEKYRAISEDLDGTFLELATF